MCVCLQVLGKVDLRVHTCGGAQTTDTLAFLPPHCPTEGLVAEGLQRASILTFRMCRQEEREGEYDERKTKTKKKTYHFREFGPADEVPVRAERTCTCSVAHAKERIEQEGKQRASGTCSAAPGNAMHS